MHRLKKLFEHKSNNILNIYFTAGHPALNATQEITLSLEAAGADIIEIGIPYSDPLADGETIQMSSEKALANGMKLNLLFEQMKQVRQHSNIPIILMGYLNQIIQYGSDRFLEACAHSGVDGLIIPDLPLEVYESEFQEKFNSLDLCISFLVTPQTSDERIAKAAKASTGFLYVVSQSQITGSKNAIGEEQISYFKKVNNIKKSTPSLIGFGIHDHTSFSTACQHANGAIIGSQFIRLLEKHGAVGTKITDFVESILSKPLST